MVGLPDPRDHQEERRRVERSIAAEIEWLEDLRELVMLTMLLLVDPDAAQDSRETLATAWKDAVIKHDIPGKHAALTDLLKGKPANGWSGG